MLRSLIPILRCGTAHRPCSARQEKHMGMGFEFLPLPCPLPLSLPALLYHLARGPVSKKSHGVASIAQLQGLHPGTRAGFINSKLPDRRPREAARVLMEALRKQCPDQLEADSCCPESVLARCKVSTPSLEDCARGCVLRGPSPRRGAPDRINPALANLPCTSFRELCQSCPKPG